MELVPIENMTTAAQWLNAVFENFDYSILAFYHNLHESAFGEFFDAVFSFITLLGEDGIFLILLSLVFMLFKKTRKVGIGMIGGVVIGAVLTNLTIKGIVARPRPYNTTETYYNWWSSVAHGLESEYSFPSGHTTSACAAMTPIFLFCNKKKSWLAFIFVILMGASRNYICVHFPSDIIGGIIVGFIAGLISYIIVSIVYDKMFTKGKLGNIVMNFDITDIFKKKKKS